MAKTTAKANANIALIKYWGKADNEENLTAVPSLSMTLAGLCTTTTVDFRPAATADEVFLDGEAANGRAKQRVVDVLERVREAAGHKLKARVDSRNNFPTAAGLASSASGFAALVLAARSAADLPLDSKVASDWARRASASAARSIYGGYVSLQARALSAEPLRAEKTLPLSLVVAVTREGPKSVGSTGGMIRTANTSPYYSAWVRSSVDIFDRARAALLAGDFTTLGELMEHSTFLMHASMMTAVPAIMYWEPASLSAQASVRQLRKESIEAYFTMDAGPHVKVLCRPDNEALVASALENTNGVLRVIRCQLGEGARIVSSAHEAQS